MYENIGKKIKGKEFPIKPLLIFAGIIILLICVLVIFAGNTYKLEMKYTEKNIERFIKGIDSHGDDLEIEIDNITVYDEESATATIYVKYSLYEAIDLRIRFNHSRRRWEEYVYQVEVYCTHHDWNSDSIIVAAVSEAMEKMLTGKTRVQENFNQHFGEDEYQKYTLGKYDCICKFSRLGGAHFDYVMEYTKHKSE